MNEDLDDLEIIDLEEEPEKDNIVIDEATLPKKEESKEQPKEKQKKEEYHNFNLPKINRGKNDNSLNQKKDNLDNGNNNLNKENSNLNNRKNPLGNNFLNKNNNTEKNTINKLNNIRNTNRVIPPISSQTLSNQSTENNDSKEEVKENIDKKIGGAALTAATGGAVRGKQAEKLSGFFKEAIKKNFKLKIMLIATISVIVFILLIILSFGASSDSGLGKDTNSYITGQMTDDELYDELSYYGYCKDKSSCKKKGVYKVFTKLKNLSEEYKKPCSNVSNNKPCGVNLNTGLIIETINYYRNSSDQFDLVELTDEEEQDENVLKKMIGNVKTYFKRKSELNSLLDDIDNLALAQAEYVENKCGNKYYQISFNKYISYLKYGNTSTHPNYSGNSVSVDTCSGPKNDYIQTSYNQDGNTNITSITGSGVGTEIVNYALQFVGGKYVWGGTDLNKGVDCSGFTMKVMEHFGIKLPHSAKAQLTAGGTNVGTDITLALPGDLIIYNGHVAIYMGNNQIVHAADEKHGIIVSKNASYSKIKGIVRYWN